MNNLQCIFFAKSLHTPAHAAERRLCIRVASNCRKSSLPHTAKLLCSRLITEGVFSKSGNTMDPLMVQRQPGAGNHRVGAASFGSRNADRPDERNTLQWSPFERHNSYFRPSAKEFMINYRVQNIKLLVKRLKYSGLTCSAKQNRSIAENSLI